MKDKKIIPLLFITSLNLATPYASDIHQTDDLKEMHQIPMRTVSLSTPTDRASLEARRRDPRYNKLRKHSPREDEETRQLLRQFSLPAIAQPIKTKDLSPARHAQSATMSGQMHHPLMTRSNSDLHLRELLLRRSSSQPNTPRDIPQGGQESSSDDEAEDPQD